MLYEAWHQTATARRHETALRDMASGATWTFAQLFDAGEKFSAGSESICCPRGGGADFIFSVLAAWRCGKIVCPLEAEQPAPTVAKLPPGCAHLKWTSGTTDTPRLIAFTAEQLAADAGHIVAAMGLRADWPNLGVISIAHSYGFSNLVTPLLLHGIPLILAPAPLPETIRRAAAEEAALTLPAVPALWRAWHEAGAIPPQIRLAISAGAPLPWSLEQSVFSATGLKIHNFYGASECGGIAYDAEPKPRTDASLAGTALPGVTVALNGEGCLKIGGDAVGQTYLPEDAGRLGGGYFHSSDLAEVKDGQIFLRGRASDLINVAGRKVSPETIERALLMHPGVRECLVFGVPSRDAGRTDEIAVLVACGADESALKQFLLNHLPAWQVPKRWCFVDSIPTSPRGKISRGECRARFAGP